MALGAGIFLVLLVTVWCKDVTISNTSPRLDDQGNILRVHDGNIMQWQAGGDYYWYGMSYGDCKEPEGGGCSHQGGDPNCGFRNTHNVSIYKSPDLSSGSWSYVGEALPIGHRPSAIYYRPKVRFNPRTEQYVLWVNAVPEGNFGGSFYVAATSATPEGPFAVQNENITMAHAAPGDFDLFVDDDGTGYLIYTSVNEGHNISVEQLAPDMLSSTRNNSGFFGATFVEAPVMFKRQGVYYAMFGHCCCFCAEGSDIGVYTASSPMGPWTTQQDIGCQAKQPSWLAGQARCTSLTQAQQNCIVEVTTTNGVEYVWTGDRWQSAPDKIKDHDFQYWSPLTFSAGQDGIPLPQQLVHLENFTLSMP
eukprot:TRINITY_DN6860_c0_g1_i1.p1 TRINITY_DN6860_c0_g1~~TRINITY_DN6860_c0_g1_i1.p1  ORF type:complete len:362 (+),score=60.38 TRINITY_DN6860_c0_g1_i1:2-1087(+)